VLFDFRNRIQAHLEITHNFLSAILPQPEQVDDLSNQYGLTCSSSYRPHDEIGGDLWALRVISDETLSLILIDASAHGLAGAINALRVDCLVQVFQEFLVDPAQFLNRLDAAMAKISFGQLFAGALVVNYNKRTGDIVYAGSGNPSPVLCHDGAATMLKTSGMLLGSGLINLENQVARMEVGDTLLAFSDGWHDNEHVDVEAILRALDVKSASLADVLANATQPMDDLTLVTLQRS
jgi:serine phosphatase RsbU (regulator of sigma subunit)